MKFIQVISDSFKEKEEEGNCILVNMDPVFDGTYYTYTQCIVSKSDYNYEDIKLKYEEWLQKQESKELEKLKQKKLEEIDKYDTSNNVNSFILNGTTVWLDKETRVGLMNSTTILKKIGETKTNLWFGDFNFSIDCDKVIDLLSELEIYALKCYNVTAKHKKEIQSLTTKKEIEDYDYTVDYPTKLDLKI